MSMDVAPGQLRTKTLLGVEATYAVLAVDGDHAQVQVVDAPGLAPGLRFRLDRSAVAEMDVVDVRAEVADGLASLLRDAA
jgi:hypothetical protein